MEGWISCQKRKKCIGMPCARRQEGKDDQQGRHLDYGFGAFEGVKSTFRQGIGGESNRKEVEEYGQGKNGSTARKSAGEIGD